eukprot:1949913-Heterocapsa_arctica.AAC.2
MFTDTVKDISLKLEGPRADDSLSVEESHGARITAKDSVYPRWQILLIAVADHAVAAFVSPKRKGSCALFLSRR